jgi:YebC/PmpR family DNA-binding regulatory protein
MAGHSHWANIAYKKAAVDKKRGKLWSNISRQILTAAKTGGGSVDSNIRLRFAVAAGRAANMSNDQIKRIIDMGTGVNSAETFEDVVYEGYAPGGCAVLVEAITDNRNRTAGEVRNILEKRGGNLGSTGSVAWQFHRRSVVRLAKGAATEDDVMNAVLDAGADDIEDTGEQFVVSGAPESLSMLQQAAQRAGFVVAAAQHAFVPKDYLEVDLATAKRVTALLEELEENDDVQHVHTHAAFPDGFEG